MPEENQGDKESFNMAVATLMRLDGILKRMEMMSEFTSGLQKQKLQIEMLRNFFLNATPLMGIVMKDEFEGYKKKILAIRIPSKIIKGKRVQYFSIETENNILSIIMDIQIKIKGYFMPPAKPKRMF